MSGAPEYCTYPRNPQVQPKTALIDEIKALRAGVESLKLRSKDDRGITFAAAVSRSFRRGAASDDEMMKYQATGAATEPGTLRLDVVAPGVFRVRFALGEAAPEVKTPMTLEQFEKPVTFTVTESPSAMTLVQGEHRVVVQLDHYEIEYQKASGESVLRVGGEERNNFKRWDSQSLGFCSLPGSSDVVAVECFGLDMDEAVYGFGESFMGLNKVGRTIHMSQKDACGTMTPRMYKCVPFYLSTRGYGVYVNQSARMTCWVGSRVTSNVQLAVEDSYLDYFVILGDGMKQVLDRYTDITGKSPVPPKWSFGLWMSKFSYQSAEEALSVARTLREKKLPADVIHLDTHWFEENWVCDLEFSKTRFPDPARMMDELRKMGFRVSLWQMPYIREKSKLFKEGVDKGYFVRNANGTLTPHPQRGVIDFTNPAAVEWLKEKFRKLFAQGAAVIKTDFGESAPDDGLYAGGTPSHRMHNLYPLLYNKAVFEVTKECTGDGLVWGRSATAGNQRYPLYWGGDNSANFENIEPSLCGGLSLGMSGFSFWSQDIGGFHGQPTPELFIRWMQAGLFGSHARIHGMNDREPYRFGAEAEEISREFLNLRSRLMPYIWSAAHASAQAGLPMMRPLVLEFERDRMVWGLSSQFMLGPALMVAPILRSGATRRDVYLPAGGWYDWWTKQRLAGGRWIEGQIPLNRVGLYVREGSLIPMGPVNQYADEHSSEQIEVHVFPGEKDIEFILQGQAPIQLRWSQQTRRLLASEGRIKIEAIVH